MSDETSMEFPNQSHCRPPSPIIPKTPKSQSQLPVQTPAHAIAPEVATTPEVRHRRTPGGVTPGEVVRLHMPKSPEVRGSSSDLGQNEGPASPAQRALEGLLRNAIPADKLGSERMTQTLHVLAREGVDAAELQSLIRTSKLRDITRSIAASELSYGLSFFPGGLTAQFLGKKNLSATAQMVGACGVIGMGGVTARHIIRDGKLAAQYNVPHASAPSPSSAGSSSFLTTCAEWLPRPESLVTLPFAIGHGAVDWLHSGKEALKYRTFCSGPIAAFCTGLLKGALLLARTTDPVWLDGTKPQQLRDAIKSLRQYTPVATAGYVSDIFKGAKDVVMGSSEANAAHGIKAWIDRLGSGGASFSEVASLGTLAFVLQLGRTVAGELVGLSDDTKRLLHLLGADLPLACWAGMQEWIQAKPGARPASHAQCEAVVPGRANAVDDLELAAMPALEVLSP